MYTTVLIVCGLVVLVVLLVAVWARIRHMERRTPEALAARIGAALRASVAGLDPEARARILARIRAQAEIDKLRRMVPDAPTWPKEHDQ
jgi:hypothetical protein